MAGKQAKILNARQIKLALAHLATTRQPKRNKVIFLLSCKAGLRVKEISNLTWSMITDSEGQLTNQIDLPDSASKGKSGRTVYMASVLKEAVADLTIPDDLYQPVIMSERFRQMSPTVLKNWFQRIYKDLGFTGCSSHSGRRTFGTMAARNVVAAGGSLKEVQELMGHSSISMTQLYIDSNEDAKRKLVELI